MPTRIHYYYVAGLPTGNVCVCFVGSFNYKVKNQGFGGYCALYRVQSTGSTVLYWYYKKEKNTTNGTKVLHPKPPP